MTTGIVQSSTSLMDTVADKSKRSSQSSDMGFEEVLNDARQDNSNKSQAASNDSSKSEKTDGQKKTVKSDSGSGKTEEAKDDNVIKAEAGDNKENLPVQDSNEDKKESKPSTADGKDSEVVIVDGYVQQSQNMLNMLVNTSETVCLRENITQQNAASLPTMPQTIEVSPQNQPVVELVGQAVVNNNAEAKPIGNAQANTSNLAAQAKAVQDEVVIEQQSSDAGQQQAKDSGQSGQYIEKAPVELKEKDIAVKMPQPEKTELAAENIDGGRMQKTGQHIEQKLESSVLPVSNNVAISNDTVAMVQPVNSNNNSDRSSEPVVLINNTGGLGRDIGVEQLLNLNKAVKPAPVDMQNNIDQVVKAVNTTIGRGDSVLTMRMDPPELGNLRVEIRMSGQDIQLQLQATNEKSHQLLQQNLPQLKAALEAAGMQNPQIQVQLRMDLQNNNANSQQNNQQQGQNQGQNSGDQSFQQQQQQAEQERREGQASQPEQFQQLNFEVIDA